MRLKSAFEDFETNTLGAVAGLLGKLSYVGRLQDDEGSYGHWGLARVYGFEAAQDAIGRCHRALLSQILKKPLAVLLKDAHESCSDEYLTEEEFLATLAQSSPKRLSRAARAHLGAVLGSLSALIEGRHDANRRDA